MFMIDLSVDSHYATLGIPPNADVEEIRAARDGIVKELKERARREKHNVAQLEQRQKEVNAAGDVLARPKEREKYDHQNAHLRYFTIQRAAAPMFSDTGDRVAVLHRVISAHLDAAGEPLRPLSDLDRADFAADAAPSPLLDSLLESLLGSPLGGGPR